MANMGMGPLGSSTVIFKRKFRWGLTVKVCGDDQKEIGEHLVKLAARPNLSIEETEINVKHAKTWIPGKASWETITVTYYDVAEKDSENGVGSDLVHLYEWLAAVYNFTAGIRGGNGGSGSANNRNLTMGSHLDDYAGVATLNMYDGCGNSLETWLMKDAWPQAVNFGDLDYSSSEEATIELTLRYSDVVYTNNCGPDIEPCPCTGCGKTE